MENPSFSHSIYNFLGVSGSVILFAVIVAYARSPEWNRTSVTPESAVTAVPLKTIAQASPELFPVVPTAEAAEDVKPLVDSSQLIAQGRMLYDSYCAACHGFAGKKRSPLLAGSDIFDDVSEYGSDDATVRRLIVDGIIEEGMVPWKSVLTPEQIDSMVAYIASERYTGNG